MNSSNRYPLSIEQSTKIIGSNKSLGIEMKKVAKSILSILEELKLSSKGEEMCAIMKFYIEENHVPDKYKNVLSDEVAQQLSNFRGDIVWSLQMSTKWEKKRNLPWFQIFFANPDRKILWNHDSMKAFLD